MRLRGKFFSVCVRACVRTRVRVRVRARVCMEYEHATLQVHAERLLSVGMLLILTAKVQQLTVFVLGLVFAVCWHHAPTALCITFPKLDFSTRSSTMMPWNDLGWVYSKHGIL